MKFPEEFPPPPPYTPSPHLPHPSHSPPPGWISWLVQFELKSLGRGEGPAASIQVVCSRSNLPCPSQINALCGFPVCPPCSTHYQIGDGYHITYLAFPHGAIP